MEKRIPPAVPTLEELKKMIRQENLSSGRLSSLRLPRDLSLGGTKPKKIYTPNLSVVRNKDKNKHVPEHSQMKTGDRFSCGQKRGAESSIPRQKNKRAKYVQSEGVFSQGIGAIKRSTHYSDKNTNIREHNSVAALMKPKINNSWNVNKTKNAALVSGLFDADESDSESDIEYDPVVLPLDRNKGNFINSFKIKQEDILNKIKKDVNETEAAVPQLINGYSSLPDVKPKSEIEKLVVDSQKYISVTETFIDGTKMYDEDNPAFSLIRLPDSFSGKTYKDDPNDKELDYILQRMPEGHVGKLLIRKSGRMEMVIKNTKYMVNGEGSSTMAETAMLFPGEQSIALEPSLVALGTITEKFTLTPEWNTLFDKAKKYNKFYW